MPTLPTLKGSDPLTDDVVRRFTCTDVGLHLASSVIKQFIRLVQTADANVAHLAHDIKLIHIAGVNCLSIADFIMLANSDLMRNKHLPTKIVPAGGWGMSYVVPVMNLATDLQQALLGA